MVGAGQLARMTAQAAVSLGIGFRVLAGDAGESAAQVCAGTELGDYRVGRPTCWPSPAGCDVVTFDHEHVPAGRCCASWSRPGARSGPGRGALRYAQDKRAMRERLAAARRALPALVRPVAGLGEVAAFAARHGWPVVLKAVTGGYDGKGVWVCADAG